MIQLHIPSERATWVRNRLTRLFIVAGVIGSILSMLVITLDGFLRPGYSPLYQMVSDLGVGQNAWLLNSDLVVSGLLIMLFAIGFSQAMRNSISGRRLVASTSLFLLAGAGIANDGFFTEYNFADPHAALHDALHTLGFFVAFISLSIAFFLIGLQLRNDRVRRGYGWYSLITGLVMLSLILLPYAFPVHGMQLEGLNERMILVAAFAWQVVTGYRLSALEQPQKVGEHAGAFAGSLDLSRVGPTYSARLHGQTEPGWFRLLSRLCSVILTGQACDRKKRGADSFGAGQ